MHRFQSEAGNTGKGIGHEYLRPFMPSGMNMTHPYVSILFLRDKHRGISCSVRRLNKAERGYNCKW